MGYFTANLPTGYYSPTSIASLGLGHWALDEGVAYTFLSESGFEASMTAGVTENVVNPSTQYQSGVDGHLDLGISYSANSDGYIGVAQLPIDVAEHAARFQYRDQAGITDCKRSRDGGG